MAGLFARVAQLRVPLPDGGEAVGSGLLIGPRLLLTAAHVVEDDDRPVPRLRVSFPDLGIEADGVPVWSGSERGLDAALVELAGPVPGVRSVRTRWGRLTGQSPGVAAFAVGFPRALREEDGQRVPDQAAGTVNPGVGFGQRYDLNVTPPHPLASRGEDPSLWSGLSGAALMGGNLLIGVVTLDVPHFQAGRLSAVPVWRLVAEDGFGQVLTRHGLATGWESVELGGLFEPSHARLDSPASLLRADNAVVRFRGRTDVLDRLHAWCDADEPLSVALVTGPGGAGKTRMARQLCQQLQGDDWLAGALRSTVTAEALAAVGDSRLPVLLVIDYAETRADQLRKLVDAIGTDPAGPVRLLLLARAVGEWWPELRADWRSRLGAPLELALPPLEDTVTGRGQAYTEAVADLAAALPRLPGRQDTDWAARAHALTAPALSAPAFGSALTLQLQALTDLLTEQGTEASPPADPAELEDVLLEHEQGYWRDTAAREGLRPPAFQPVTLRRTIAVATLCGAASESDALATVTRVPGLADKSHDERLGVARWLADLYPSPASHYWGSLQPDRLGEHLIGAVTADRPDLLPAALIGATGEQQYQALTVLARASAHQARLPALLEALLTQRLAEVGPVALQVAVQADTPAPILDALRVAVAAAAPDADQLHTLHDALPRDSRMLAQISLDLTTRLVELHQELSKCDPDTALPALAMSLNNLSNRLAAVGRREQALAPIQEAVQTYRRLAETAPAAYLPDLAMALNTLSIRLAEVGRREEALDPIEEAVGIRRRLADTASDAYLPDLAQALNNLSNLLAEVGRRGEALAPIEEAVAIRRRLAQTNPDASLPDLALSLNNLSIRLGEVGRRGEALDPIEEAVRIRRRLADTAPDAYLPALAASLHILSIGLAEVGRRGEALAPIQEAVGIRRRLADTAPDAYLPALAASLNTLSIGLAAVERHGEALAPIEEAVQTYRRLAQTNPDAHMPDLAGLLNTLSIGLAAVGRGREALAPIEEAVQTYRRLAQDAPDAYLPALAMSLNNLSNRLAAVGQQEQALVLIKEAVAAYRRLAETAPDAYLPDLAMSLTNLSNRLAEGGRETEALAPIEEAVQNNRRLAQAIPDAYLPDLAGALSNLAIRLAAVGRRKQALAPIEEAVAICRRLAEAYPDTLRPVLARSLLAHAWLLRGAGHTTALVSVVDEALDITDDKDLVAAGARLLREERRSDPGSFDVVWAQQVGDPVPDWLRQES